MKFYKPSEEEMKTVDDIREENRQELLGLKNKKKKIIIRLAYLFVFAAIFYLVVRWELNILDSYNNDIDNVINGTSNKKDEIKLNSIRLSVEKDTLEVDEYVTINVTYNPTDATNKQLTWTSNNEKVATVVNGTVTGVASGEALITAKGNGDVADVIMIYVK